MAQGDPSQQVVELCLVIALHSLILGDIVDSEHQVSSHCIISISNNPGFRLKNPGVPDGSDSSDRTSYPLTENYTLPGAQATGRVA